MKKWVKLFFFTMIISIIPVVITSCVGANEENNEEQRNNSNEGNAETTPSNQNGENNASQSNSNDQTTNDQSRTEQEDPIVWGVDSASYTTVNLLQCVTSNYGNPQVWGRYLGTKEGISAGLDQQEVELLQDNNIEILPIYNHVENLTGYEKGVNEAESAISMAEDLGIPAGVAIFVDAEPIYPVDSAFIQGWYDTINASDYVAGLYGVFEPDSNLSNAFNAISNEAKKNTIIWSAYPKTQITTKENAPSYQPEGPENFKLYGWQYGIEAETCNIDTNLFKEEMIKYLW
ncbi:glycoside hydrolase domain-containing protein [Aquibacillus salsiterrae]|uniref:DUF1906 domain-containing protein n=1 Tax=Aquibacillus salsiterrae TaxID=2950439 RepID=A0A9X3WDK1_9BACI|nr:glycoside hydrolase domain-containing protein [Aquibacillus salsiterrae]MDC3417902.1 DUF1906 domain-containing protein [Aquibacillus salsiterrae]